MIDVVIRLVECTSAALSASKDDKHIKNKVPSGGSHPLLPRGEHVVRRAVVGHEMQSTPFSSRDVWFMLTRTDFEPRREPEIQAAPVSDDR